MMKNNVIVYSVERIAYSKKKNIFLSFLSAIRYPLNAKAGFTLAEVLLAVSILAFGLCGILVTYISMHIFSDLSRDFTTVSSALQAKAEEIKRTAFSALSGLNGTTFDLSGFAANNAKGVIEVTDIEGYTDLKRVRIIASFKSRARVIGEDVNLNGSLNIGEDANNNGRLDSPAELIALIAK